MTAGQASDDASRSGCPGTGSREATDAEIAWWHVIQATHRAVHEEIERTLELHFAVSPMEYASLEYLSHSDEPTQVRDLAHAVGLSPSSTSRMVARLGQRQLVDKTFGEQDRRSVLISLSKAGAALLKAAQPHYRTAVARCIDETGVMPGG